MDIVSAWLSSPQHNKKTSDLPLVVHVDKESVVLELHSKTLTLSLNDFPELAGLKANQSTQIDLWHKFLRLSLQQNPNRLLLGDSAQLEFSSLKTPEKLISLQKDWAQLLDNFPKEWFSFSLSTQESATANEIPEDKTAALLKALLPLLASPDPFLELTRLSSQILESTRSDASLPSTQESNLAGSKEKFLLQQMILTDLGNLEKVLEPLEAIYSRSSPLSSPLLESTPSTFSFTSSPSPSPTSPSSIPSPSLLPEKPQEAKTLLQHLISLVHLKENPLSPLTDSSRNAFAESIPLPSSPQSSSLHSVLTQAHNVYLDLLQEKVNWLQNGLSEGYHSPLNPRQKIELSQDLAHLELSSENASPKTQILLNSLRDLLKTRPLSVEHMLSKTAEFKNANAPLENLLKLLLSSQTEEKEEPTKSQSPTKPNPTIPAIDPLLNAPDSAQNFSSSKSNKESQESPLPSLLSEPFIEAAKPFQPTDSATSRSLETHPLLTAPLDSITQKDQTLSPTSLTLHWLNQLEDPELTWNPKHLFESLKLISRTHQFEENLDETSLFSTLKLLEVFKQLGKENPLRDLFPQMDSTHIDNELQRIEKHLPDTLQLKELSFEKIPEFQIPDKKELITPQELSAWVEHLKPHSEESNRETQKLKERIWTDALENKSKDGQHLVYFQSSPQRLQPVKLQMQDKRKNKSGRGDEIKFRILTQMPRMGSIQVYGRLHSVKSQGETLDLRLYTEKKGFADELKEGREALAKEMQSLQWILGELAIFEPQLKLRTSTENPESQNALRLDLRA